MDTRKTTQQGKEYDNTTAHTCYRYQDVYEQRAVRSCPMSVCGVLVPCSDEGVFCKPVQFGQAYLFTINTVSTASVARQYEFKTRHEVSNLFCPQEP